MSEKNALGFIHALMDQGDWQQAHTRVAQLSEKEALSEEGCQLRAYLATLQGDLLSAEQALRQASVNLNNRLLLASNLHKQQRFLEAQQQLLALVVEYPEVVAVHFNLAQSYLATNHLTAALPELLFCLAHRVNNHALLFQVASIYCQLDQHAVAKIYLEQLLTIEPHHVEALNNLGVCHLKAKHALLAIQCFATAMRIDDQHLPSLSNLAMTLYQEQRFSEALVYFEQYLRLAPREIEINYHVGVVALMLVQFDRAQQSFQTVLAQNAMHVPSMLNLAAIALKKREPSNALAWYQRVLGVEPQQAIAAYMVSALLGDRACIKAPNAYIEALFDQYAAHFDQHLLQDLAYQTPQQLRKLYDRLPKVKRRKGYLLDLGCGTGLSGAVFNDIAVEMVGVDLSNQMLIEAQAKNIYHTTVKADIVAYLKTVEQRFDIIVLADVIVYVGDLTELFALMAMRLAPDGIILLSVELAPATLKASYGLTATGRFQHQLPYIHHVAKANQLSLLREKTVPLRSQEGQAVSGQIMAFQRVA